MKKSLLILALLGIQSTASAELMITAVYDGPITGGLPKGVELYVTEDIPDLSIYSLGSANNGGGSDGEEFTFPASPATAGDFIYVASEATEFTAFFGFTPNYTTSAMSINGDDAIELFANGVVIDLFGDINVDGSGQVWEYTDGWAYRNNGRTGSETFIAGNWLFSGPNALDGESSNATATTPVPIGSFIPNDDPGGTASNVIINEVDADTEGTDTLEFIELYDGGIGNTDLTGLVLVLYNGSDDASYDSFDLDGFSTNASGYFVLGNPGVTNVDLVIGNSNSIQNGTDAVALIIGNATDYPNDTPVDSNNVLDAIVYDTDDADDPALLVLLNAGQPQINEAAGDGSTLDSNQRCENGTGGGRNTESYTQAMPTPGAANACSLNIGLRLISEIQGNPSNYGSNSFGDTDVSPLIDTIVTIQGVVVGDFQDGDSDDSRNLRGFFVQEEDSDNDNDPLSSEGIFIFDPAFINDVNVGDLVSVTGTVDQFFGESQISNLIEVEILATNQLGLVSPAIISLLNDSAVTLNQNNQYQPDLESYEGMLVSFAETLQITEQFNLDRFNEIKLVAGERPVQFTQTNSPDPILYELNRQALGARRITYDDGLNIQNAGINNLDGFANYNEASAKRMGDTVTNLTGVLDYKFAGSSSSGSTWRVRSHINGSNIFSSSLDGSNAPNPRPGTAETVAGTLKVASFNVLNFFTTLDDGNTLTAVGQSPRGADDLSRFGVEPASAEFDRQVTKIVNAILELDADVLGLIEIENEFDAVNDGSTAIEYLVNQLNAAAGITLYDYVYPGRQFLGTDAIAVAIIYKPAIVSIAENTVAAILDDTVGATLPSFLSRDFTADPIFNGIATNRISLAASFTHLASEDTFTLVVNHFKSKGPSGLTDGNSPNFDQADGAGFWNQRRLDAAIAVNEWVATAPTGSDDADVIILGDLNAYAQEAPVQYLLSNGYNNVENADAYSFVFDGQTGTLDYVLISDQLLEKFTAASIWHINADEADALDYNLDFGRNPTYFDAATATRNSDHDPLLAGFNLIKNLATAEEAYTAYLAGLASGDIQGAGRFPIKQKISEYIFAYMLQRAIYFNNKGRVELACHILHRTDVYSDGEQQPNDLIVGNDVPALNMLIKEARQNLGCNTQ